MDVLYRKVNSSITPIGHEVEKNLILQDSVGGVRHRYTDMGEFVYRSTTPRTSHPEIAQRTSAHIFGDIRYLINVKQEYWSLVA